MGLRASIQKVVQSGFLALDDLPTLVKYTAVGEAVYDPTDGTIVKTDVEYPNLSFQLMSYKVEEIDGEVIKKTDQKAMIPTLNFTPTPKEDDIMEINDANWQVVAFKQDPAKAVWTIQIRKP